MRACCIITCCTPRQMQEKTQLTILWLCGQQVLAQVQLALNAPVS
jgi:hypothetical protein